MAAALSPLFDAVTIYEKDRLPASPEPRKGVAQGQHAHVFLVGGLTSLDDLLPGIVEDFRNAGAVPVDLGHFDMFDFGSMRPRRALGLSIFCLSRPSYEHVLRRRLAVLRNVKLVEEAPVERVEIRGGSAVGLRLAGRSGHEQADFVVDATGRGGVLVQQLRDEGYGETPETRIAIDMCYASARFRLAERWRGATAAMCVPTPPDKRYGVVLPIEGGLCLVSLGGRCGVEPSTDLHDFLGYAEQLACTAIFDRLRDAEPVGAIRRYRKPRATWRHYEAVPNFPERLAPVGDTIASFNPTWGQGMTVAARHAVALAETLRETGLDGPAFASRYLPRAAAGSEEAWQGTALIDLAYPEVTGDRPPDFAQSLAYARGVRTLADADPSVHRLQYEVLHLARPRSALGDPALAARVAAVSVPT